MLVSAVWFFMPDNFFWQILLLPVLRFTLSKKFFVISWHIFFYFNVALHVIWLQVDPLSCASSGMFVSLSAVMLRLCEPFLDLTKMDKIDPKYVFYSTRLDLR